MQARIVSCSFMAFARKTRIVRAVVLRSRVKLRINVDRERLHQYAGALCRTRSRGVPEGTGAAFREKLIHSTSSVDGVVICTRTKDRSKMS